MVEYIKGLLTSRTAIVLSVGGIIAYYVHHQRRKNPGKTTLFYALNTMLEPLRLLEIGPFKNSSNMHEYLIEDSIREAMSRTKLNDIYGDHPAGFMERYKTLIEFPFFKSLRFSNLGYISVKESLISIFMHRLRKIDYLKRHPEISTIPVSSPLFVIGLPRSGTSFIHRLLSLDPNARAPLLWEYLDSVPTTELSDSEEAKALCRKNRCETLQRNLDLYRQVNAGDVFDYIHETRADITDECIYVFQEDYPMVPWAFLSLMHNNGAMKINDDWVNIMQYHKKTLQLLSYQIGELERPRRWVLKCPFYSTATKEVLATYPDAKFVRMHRHPVKVVGSMISIMFQAHQAFHEKIDNSAVNQVAEAVAYGVGRMARTMSQDYARNPYPCIDIVYTDLEADPIKVVKDIYKFYNWKFTAEYENILNEYLKNNYKDRNNLKSKNRDGNLHSYNIKDYGLTESFLKEGPFKDCTDNFNLQLK